MENYIEIVTLYVLVIPSLVLPQSCLSLCLGPSLKFIMMLLLEKLQL